MKQVIHTYTQRILTPLFNFIFIIAPLSKKLKTSSCSSSEIIIEYNTEPSLPQATYSSASNSNNNNNNSDDDSILQQVARNGQLNIDWIVMKAILRRKISEVIKLIYLFSCDHAMYISVFYVVCTYRILFFIISIPAPNC